eukprot:1348690-Amorphochlora_amoeboformis.AAC.1
MLIAGAATPPAEKAFSFPVIMAGGLASVERPADSSPRHAHSTSPAPPISIRRVGFLKYTPLIRG